MHKTDIECVEINLLLDAILHRYGYDFRNYARASIRRRILHFMRLVGCDTIAELIPRIMHDEAFFNQLASEFSITVTEMFRDPAVFVALRKDVLPVLRTFPFVRIWHAGCSTGEEAYSLAILLVEENIREKVTMFATDFNDEALRKAKNGIYDLAQTQQSTDNYHKAQGRASFSDYYSAGYGSVTMKRFLKNNITFANHNLVTDQVFCEAHLILCRNVLIYFDKELQERVLGIFYESLVRGGFLCLGKKESLMFSQYEEMFEIVDATNKIFKKRF